MLLCGADVIGDDQVSEHQFIGFVIGTEENVNSVYKDIGISPIHMRDLSPKKRIQVIRNISFDDHNITAWCLHVERQNIVDTIKNHEDLQPRHKRGPKIQKHFDHLLMTEIRESVEEFTINRGSHFEDLTMQCDGDMLHTAINWKMGTCRKGRAFELSDAIAWCNQRRHRIPGCKEIDLRDNLMNGMLRDLI